MSSLYESPHPGVFTGVFTAVLVNVSVGVNVLEFVDVKVFVGV
jgi:hypothetical protein